MASHILATIFFFTEIILVNFMVLMVPNNTIVNGDFKSRHGIFIVLVISGYQYSYSCS